MYILNNIKKEKSMYSIAQHSKMQMHISGC